MAKIALDVISMPIAVGVAVVDLEVALIRLTRPNVPAVQDNGKTVPQVLTVLLPMLQIVEVVKLILLAVGALLVQVELV